MKIAKHTSPFFVVNPKSYITGKEILDLALAADQFAQEHDFDVYFTAQYVDLAIIAKETNYLIVTTQHMDHIELGRGMGYVTADALVQAGVRATMLNHAEHQMQLGDLIKSIEQAKKKGITTIVCADSVTEAEAIAKLSPDIILCEPTELIGTGQTSDESYILETNERIRAVSEGILVMQAAGISNEEDVYRTIVAGADGTGCTSGIVKADDPKEMIKLMLNAVERGYTQR